MSKPKAVKEKAKILATKIVYDCGLVRISNKPDYLVDLISSWIESDYRKLLRAAKAKRNGGKR